MNYFSFALIAIVGFQLTAAFTYQEQKILQTFQNPMDDENYQNERPKSGQKSLLIAFDTTASMEKDLIQLREGAKDIVNNFASRKDQPIYNYVLSLFNDPKVEPALVSRNFTVILNRLNGIVVDGGGLCPEKALTGLRGAIDNGLQKSPAFLFSDASATDYDEYDQTAALIQRKQTNVNFFLTGDCGAPSSPHYKVYNKIARISGGQVYRLTYGSKEVREVLVATSVSLENDFVALKSFDSETAGSTVVPVTIDVSVTRMSVTLTGTKAKLVIKDESGVPVTSAKSTSDNFSSDNIQIFTFATTSSKYTIEASAQSDYAIRVGGLSDLKFDFGFSQRSPSAITDTYFRPLAGKKTILSVFVSDFSQIKNLEFATIIPASSTTEFEEFQVNLKRDKKGFYVTEPFDSPSKMFRVQIRGYDPKDNVIDRLISTGIEATTGIEPSVEIDFKRLSAPEKGKLTLDCKVKSLTPVKIQWKYYDEIFQEKSFDESVNFALELNNFGESKVGNYSCFAENEVGSDSMTVPVHLCSLDTDPTCTSFAITGKNISNTLLMLTISVILTKLLKF